MKTKTIPFDAEMAKKIQAGEMEGRIRTKEGDFTARIICFDKIKLVHSDCTTERQIVSLTYNENAREDVMHIHNQKGEVQTQFEWEHGYDLVLEVPDTAPEFKPFDKVLVRDDDTGEWCLAFYAYRVKTGFHRMVGGACWSQCIPYCGHEHLLGTTDKPKEE